MIESFIFDWQDLARITITATTMYVLIIMYIKMFGKRSTSEFNNYDWIVTVMIGSISASAVILENVSVIHGGIGIVYLMVLQYSVTKVMYHSKLFREVVKATPQLLLFEGEFLEENMEAERIMHPEVYAAIRQHGLKSVKQVYAVILETNSMISVIPNDDSNELGFSLSDVQGLPDGLKKDLEDRDDADVEGSSS